MSVVQEVGPSKPVAEPKGEEAKATGKPKNSKLAGPNPREPPESEVKVEARGVPQGQDQEVPSSLEAALVLIEAASRGRGAGNPKTALRHLQSVAMLCQGRLQGGHVIHLLHSGLLLCLPS